MNPRHPDRENSRAVLIGVGAYQHHDRLPHIPAVDNNIDDLHQLLTASGGTFDPERCQAVTDPANTDEIGQILEAAAVARDTLLIYYTGHGLLDSSGHLHLALPGTHPDRTRFTALPITVLRDSILDSPATTRILILDCCFSGRAFDALSDGPDVILGQADVAGTYTITSSARNETSYAPPGQPNTAFTAALLASAITTPGLTLDELYVDIEHHLHRNGHPPPQRRSVNNAGRLVLFPRTPAPGTVEVLERTFDQQRRVLGPAHAHTLDTGDNLARAYSAAGRVADSVELYEVTLDQRRRVLGPTHPHTLDTGDNLARAYSAAGRVADSVELYETTLDQRRRALGPEHPDTLTTGHNLAVAYREMGRVTDAIELYEKTLERGRRVFGLDHPDTMTTRDGLAGAYSAAGRVADAIDVFEETLADRRRVLGAAHKDTLETSVHLAVAYREAGRFRDAIELFEQTLSDRERVFGPGDPGFLNANDHLAVAYRQAGRVAEAIALFERTLSDRERVFGLDDPVTLNTSHHLAVAYRQAGRVADAIGLFESTLDRRRRVLGPTHPGTAATGDELAEAHRAARKLAEVFALLEKALNPLEEGLGSDHPTVAQFRDFLDAFPGPMAGDVGADKRGIPSGRAGEGTTAISHRSASEWLRGLWRGV
ncbi:caspase, EACC1-associated type [Nocardia bovistercoris]|uniref:Tetratricopeptide repeat protein n=1 Tax=Nocardia bovistercoris TaxID=2785916 RepID=A0A931N543_9NOCA|nr:tetratricopeptide repeat protein [Nocardia bovistercoris]MBH0779362.1 tetratricopeptide repeat protein [Nocardia bovistercoris]